MSFDRLLLYALAVVVAFLAFARWREGRTATPPTPGPGSQLRTPGEIQSLDELELLYG